MRVILFSGFMFFVNFCFSFSNVEQNILDNLLRQEEVLEKNVLKGALKYINSLPNDLEHNVILNELRSKEKEIFKMTSEEFEESESVKTIKDENELVKEYFRDLLLNGGEETKKKHYLDKGFFVVLMATGIGIYIKLFLLDRKSKKHEKNLAEIKVWDQEKEKYRSEMKEKMNILNKQHAETLDIYDKLLVFMDTPSKHLQSKT